MKMRLDEWLTENGFASTRSKAKRLIQEGAIAVNKKRVTKAGFKVASADRIHVEKQIEYVGRGALKMEAAIQSFNVDCEGFLVADIGASTGGFTDYLLKHGAKLVYAIDVGHGQLDKKLVKDDRVINMEGINIRHGVDLPDPIDLAVVDLSFISLRLCMQNIFRLVKTGGTVICLIKPQFEAGPGVVNKNGIIKDPRKRKQVLGDFLAWCEDNGYELKDLIESPIQGGDGNVEFLGLFKAP